MSLSTLGAPTGILLSESEDELFVCDWRRAIIYTIALASTQPQTHVLAGDGMQRPIFDGNETHAPTLSGPTQLAIFPGLGIVFTDRNPDMNTAAVRLLRLDGQFRGRVETLAGTACVGRESKLLSSRWLTMCALYQAGIHAGGLTATSMGQDWQRSGMPRTAPLRVRLWFRSPWLVDYVESTI